MHVFLMCHVMIHETTPGVLRHLQYKLSKHAHMTEGVEYNI